MFFVHNRFYNIKFLNEILKFKSDTWNKLLIENPVGNPVPFFLYKKSSGNRIRHVFLLKKIFEYCQITDSRLSDRDRRWDMDVWLKFLMI
jgi:hypothetical protein